MTAQNVLTRIQRAITDRQAKENTFGHDDQAYFENGGAVYGLMLAEAWLRWELESEECNDEHVR